MSTAFYTAFRSTQSNLFNDSINSIMTTVSMSIVDFDLEYEDIKTEIPDEKSELKWLLKVGISNKMN